MKTASFSSRALISLAALLLFMAAAAGSLVSGTAAGSSKGQAAKGKQGNAAAGQPTAASAEYAGQETCAGCHPDVHADQLPYHKAIATNKRWNWAGRTCEACHGPGKAHAEAADPKLILSFKRARAVEVDQKCLTCHSQALGGADHAFDAHFRNGVSCVKCHTVHGARVDKLLAAKPERFCVSCHSNVRAEFYRPYRHRLPEGMIGCLDCHDPHGSPRQGNLWKAQLRRVGAGEPACLKCHTNVRGPFVFEHPVVKSEGCQFCHEGHGSVNPRMLVRAPVRFLCLECHTNSKTALGGTPPAFHDLRTPRYQNCTACHNHIHGSYVDQFFER